MLKHPAAAAAAYAATLAVMLLVDIVWLGLIARPYYQQGLAHLMAPQPNLMAAALFYLLYPLALMLFAVLPLAATGGLPGWPRTLVAAALFGFFAYATYDLTNLATLKGWPAGLAAMDMAWGSIVSTVSAAAGRATWNRVAAA